MLTKLVSGVLREVWQETDPIIGGQSRTIVTGIKATDAVRSRTLAFLFLANPVQTPQITGSITIVGRRLAISITNAGAIGSSATYTLDVSLLHSLQQGRERGLATGVVHVLADSSTFGVPAATAISAGAESPAHFSKVEALPAPAVITADKAKLNALSPAGLLDFCNINFPLYAPGVSQVREFDLGQTKSTPEFGVNFVEDITQPGNPGTPINGAWNLISSRLVYNSTGQPWVVGFDAVIPVPVAGCYGYLGLTENTVGTIGSRFCGMGALWAVDETHLAMQANNGIGAATPVVTSWVIDGQRHLFVLGFDGVACSIYVDGVKVGSTASLAFFPALALGVAILGIATSKMSLWRFFVGV
jgi:hypothetical protein